MNDPYLYEGSSVLRNSLNIHDEKELGAALPGKSLLHK